MKASVLHTVQPHSPCEQDDAACASGALAAWGSVATASEDPHLEDARSLAEIRVVDDDPEIRDSLTRLMESVGLRVRSFGSAEELLTDPGSERPGCLLLDARLPGVSGLELLERLNAAGDVRPVIVISGHADVPTAVRAMKAGALDFFEKPIHAQSMLERVEEAIRVDARARERRRRRRDAAARLASLTGREVEVVALVMAGKLNKEVARAMAISQKTVEFHRSHAMRKAGARHLSELILLVLAAHGEDRGAR